MTTDSELVRGVFATIRRYGMLAGGETVLVGVSGGADSVALLHILHSLSRRLSLTLHLVHVNHGLRPEADADQAFVEDLARRWGLPVSPERVEVRAGGGRSPEAAARAVRYQAFQRAAARVGATRVALGHTADDQAETVLMRLLEGAGPRGLSGIPPVRAPFIRPLLESRRHQIVEELERAGLPWREDPTNQDPKFLRNRVRHDLLPFLTASYAPRIVDTLCRAAALTRSLVTELEALAQRELDRLALTRGQEIVMPLAALKELSSPVGEELLRLALARLGEGGPLRGWARRRLHSFLTGEGPAGPFRIGGVVLERSEGQLRLCRGNPPALAERQLPVPGFLTLAELELVLEARSFPRPAEYRPPRSPWHVAFDGEQLGAPLWVRGRGPGDRFHPFGAPGAKRLKAFLIDAKLPRWERRRLPLVVAGGEIVWVVGLRRGAQAPVTPRTRRVVELRALPPATPAP
ncbi:MAG: tRNA lysidine(34) synthetase TilS [Candidatus Methylomirabilia bacterium]